MNDIKNLESWSEPVRGIYRYVLSSGACYEIHILYHADGTDIRTAKASLYIVGALVDNGSGNRFFERECLLFKQPVDECLRAAYEDNE